MYTDAHAHPYDVFIATGKEPDLSLTGALCANSHCMEEFLWQEEFASRSGRRVLLSFGVHPQDPDPAGLETLDALAREGRIDAVGEAGFDLFDAGFKSTEALQREVWAAQLEIAKARGLPLVVHCRKAMHFLFADSRALSRLRSVIFHGWPGSPAEARAFLGRGINAWFSAGKGLLRGDRSLIATVAEIGPDRVLAETDAPWMTLRGEPYSVPTDIVPVHASLAELLGLSPAVAAGRIGENFRKAFGTGL